MDTIRVLRLIEYVGPRDWVENTLKKSIQGTLWCSEPSIPSSNRPLKMIRTATLGTIPEILDEGEVLNIVEYLGKKRGQGFGEVDCA
jgi:hypothetical protein